MKVIIPFVFLMNFYNSHGGWKSLDGWHNRNMMDKLRNMSQVLLHDSDQKIEQLEYIRQDSLRSPPFEVGYLMYNIQEEYRRMVDKYNTSLYMNKRLYLIELTLYLEDIEFHHWRVDHFANMLHEIERKYNVTSRPNATYVDPKKAMPDFDVAKTIRPRSTRKRKKPKLEEKLLTRYYVSSSTNVTPPQKSILDEVSWAVKLKLLNDCTKDTNDKTRRVGIESLVMPPHPRALYTLKTVPDLGSNRREFLIQSLVLKRANPGLHDDYQKETYDSVPSNNMKIEAIEEEKHFNSDLDQRKQDISSLESSELNENFQRDVDSEESSLSIETNRKQTHAYNYNRKSNRKYFNNKRKFKQRNDLKTDDLREVNTSNEDGKKYQNDERSKLRRKLEEDTSHPEIPTAAEVENTDENDMKLKLFRLMYETVRDSDLKVKRAELIKGHYNNSTSFEIGYIMGDITDKFNIISDIGATLKRLYHDWKPIEHINAYEQIANQAIEINHLIDILRTVKEEENNKLFKKY